VKNAHNALPFLRVFGYVPPVWGLIYPKDSPQTKEKKLFHSISTKDIGIRHSIIQKRVVNGVRETVSPSSEFTDLVVLAVGS
jgi:hypothetical protein